MSRPERTLRDGVLHDLRRAGIDVSVLQVSGMSLCDADERYEQTFHAVGGGDGPVRPDPQRSDGWRRRWGAGGSGHPPGGLGMIGIGSAGQPRCCSGNSRTSRTLTARSALD